MTLATETAECSQLEDQLERLKSELAEQLVRDPSASTVSAIEARIEETWAAIDACPEAD